MKTGIELIAEERKEQIKKHGYDAEFVKDCPHYYENGQMAFAALMLLKSEFSYLQVPDYPENWPDEDCSKMLSKSHIDKLIVAGALIAAEIDRLQV